MINKIKNTVPWTYSNDEEIIRTFYEKELQKKKTNQKKLIIEKLIKKKGNKVYVN